MYIKKSTLCWDCKNYNCSWITRGKPVEGWKAKKTRVIAKETKGGAGALNSFVVSKCPEYKKNK